METLECIRDRADVRRFKPDPVSDELIQELIAAAVQAPSSGNVQDWEFIIVRKSETKRALADAAMGQDFIADAPVVVVVCSNLSRVAARYGERGRTLYAIQNTAAATQNLALAAWDKGLASCWVGAFSEEAVRKILAIPRDVRPLVIMPLGWPAGRPTKPQRRDIREIMHKELFGGRI